MDFICIMKPLNLHIMKGILISLLILVVCQLCLASEKNTLPEEPWRAITFMEKASPDIRWEGDISIKLFGNYSQEDSLMIENSIKILNELCETVTLSITPYDRGNLELYFLDSINKQAYESIVHIEKDQKSNWQYNSNQKKIITHFNQALNFELVPKENQQNFLTNTLAWSLYPKQLSCDYLYENGREVYQKKASVFYQFTSTKVKWVKDKVFLNSKLSQFDRQIIKAVYASNYAQLLPIAKKQYNLLPSWVNKNSYFILVFPSVLALFLLTGLIILFYKKVGVKIQNKIAQFNVISALALLSIGAIGTLYIISADQLHNPYFSFFNTMDILLVFFVLLVIGLPALNIIRKIELSIHKHTQHRYFKVLLLFLSTSLIPTVSLLLIVYATTRGDLNKEVVLVIIRFFCVFTIIGAIRALISSFILKEKELKIENEVKLAKMQELKTKAELGALHSKINPHFLYNSLNSIAGLAKTDSEKTEHMALSLSKLFRYSINKEQSDWSTLEEEIQMVNIYLDIEKVRFDDRLKFTIDLPDELKTSKIPRFSIQPLVENAIKHGISKLVTKGEIHISAKKTEKWMEITVSDNGLEFPKELVPGFGIQSIYDKLEIMYPNGFELHFVNAPNKHIMLKLS